MYYYQTATVNCSFSYSYTIKQNKNNIYNESIKRNAIKKWG